MVLTGCSSKDDFKETKDYINLIRQNVIKQRKKIPALQITLPQPISYQSAKLRDPFKSPSQVTKNKSKQDYNMLTNYPLNMLRFVGTLSKNDVLHAYILAPDNKLYTVKVGDRIGDHEGTVRQIFPNRLEIAEQDSDNNKLNPKLITLQLKEESH